ncbi:MAG: stage II sporulation protein R [Oscillospiraceae bacterium]|nr:stage II sporulation protein R [Oscillospiraceae bacterium]
MKKTSLRRWEAALLAGVAIAALCSGWAAQGQAELASKVIRLHVIANSDSEADQALKLLVRDAVLAQAAGLVEEGASLEAAEAALAGHLEELAEAGAAVVASEGQSYPVSASLEQTWFPTKEYDGFALPAGNYQALRIVIGEGSGRNWWCVVFPPLCLSSVSEVADTAMAAGLEEDEVKLITGESGGYVVKFKCMELIDQLRNWLER